MQAEQMCVTGKFDSTLIAAWISIGESATIVCKSIIQYYIIHDQLISSFILSNLNQLEY